MGSRAISLLVGVISIVDLLITPLITTHEPPSGGPLKGSIGVPFKGICKGSIKGLGFRGLGYRGF